MRPLPNRARTELRASASVVLIAALLTTSLYAAGPVITELEPRGAERGHPFTLTISGKNLGTGARLSSPMPASFTLVQTETMPGRSVAFLVEPKSDLAPGVYPIRLRTTTGLSNVLLFTVGTFAEMTEEESLPYSKPNRNDSIETAEPLPSTPLIVNGTLRGAERDIYRVYGKAGERRVFEIEARRCGSAIDPVVIILDGSGKQLARSDDAPGAGLDARLDFTFPHEGNYYVAVHDARFSRQTQNFYRLKMGSYPYADGFFPLGGRRGQTTEITFFGPGLGAPVKSKIDLSKASAGLTTVSVPNSPTLPMVFAVSDLPELLAPVNGPLPVPSVINARLSKPGEIHRYKVKAEPGDKLLFEIQARDLGTSRLEAIITAYDSAGKKIDSAGDKPLPEDVFAVQGTSRTSSDPFLNVTVPKDTHEITLAVEDLAERGGALYGYRLITRRQAEDFRLVVDTPYVNIPSGGTAMIDVGADRLGYDGPIQLTIPDLPKGITVEGGFIPREYVDPSNTRTYNRYGMLALTAAPGVELDTRQLTVVGEGKLMDGSVLRRTARGPGMLVDVAGATAQGVVDRQRPVNAPWLNIELPAAVGEPALATLAVKQTSVKNLEEGGRYEFSYEWKMRNGTPPKDIDVEIVGAKDIRVIDIKPDGKDGTFVVTTTKATDPARYNMYITGRVGEDRIVSRPITFEVSEGTSK